MVAPGSATKPDYTVLATLTLAGRPTRRVPCKVFLPKRIEERPRLVFDLTLRQSREILDRLEEPSLRARIRHSGGGAYAELKAPKVRRKGVEALMMGPRLVGYQMVGEPQNLVVKRHLPKASPKSKRDCITWWVSENAQLTPMHSTSSSYDGNYRIKRYGPKSRFTLAKGVGMVFEKRYRSQREGNEFRQWSHLVAECTPRSSWKDAHVAALEMLPMMDDFLLLASFACRERTACLGWTAVDSKSLVTFYRGDYTFPKRPKSGSGHDELVGRPLLFKFLQMAYPRFRDHKTPSSLRDAFLTLLPDRRLPIEWGFITVFAALEGVLLDFRRKHGLEYIVQSKRQWVVISQGIRNHLKTQTMSALSKESRGWLYSKVNELNRVPIGAAFEGFCKQFPIPTGDLWPIAEKPPRIGLAEIRNKLVHGEFKAVQDFDTLWLAEQHLRWTLERMLLATLGWPVENSSVSPEELKKLPPIYQNMLELKAQLELNAKGP